MWERVRRRAAGVVGPDGRGVDPAGEWPWPVRLTGVTPTGIEVTLRPLTTDDGPAFQSVRRANAAWLEEWDATSPDPDAPARTFEELVEQYDRDGRAGRALPFAVEVEGRFVGQLSVGSIVLGSFRSCYVGYWVSRAVAGQMVIPTALALAGDHALGTLGLHRLEVNIRPENTASLAVVRKLGFRPRGAAPALPAHRRRVARPPVVRADHRGPRRRDARRPAGADRRAGVGNRREYLWNTVVTTVTCATHRRGSGARRGRAPTVVTCSRRRA